MEDKSSAMLGKLDSRAVLDCRSVDAIPATLMGEM